MRRTHQEFTAVGRSAVEMLESRLLLSTGVFGLTQPIGAADLPGAVSYSNGVYAIGGKRPDAFFRGFVEFLCDLEAGELHQLPELLVAVLHLQRDQKIGGHDIHLTVGRDDEPTDNNVRALVPNNEQPIAIGGVSHGLRLFALLKRELFASSGPGGVPGAYLYNSTERSAPPEGDQAARLRFDTARLLLRFMDPTHP